MVAFKNFFNRFKSRSKSAISIRQVEYQVLTPENDHSQGFFSDSPVSDPKLDRFNRWPFAQRLARTITNRSDNSNLVIGIYGSWGEGKTSVLEFIKSELASFDQIVCVNFNPWRYPSEDKLILEFYQNIAKVLGKSLETRKELVGRILKNFSSTFDLLEKGGSVAKGIVEFLANITAEEYKERLEILLKVTEKRIVIIMDDIDRLNRSEIQSVFRLVKLSADFVNTVYILSFDEDVVSEALGEQYGSAGKESGRRFLEKIITVPLHLPPATKLSLRSLCLDGIKKSLEDNKIKITPEDQALFLEIFDRLLYLKLRTPRMIKRYNNAVFFALPIMLGEAYSIDIMFIEGLRVFYTSIYNKIKEHEDIFLCKPENPFSDRTKFQAYARDILDNLLSDLSSNEANALKETLTEIFPGLSHSLNGTEFKESRSLAENKRIGSRHYFKRYFYYTITDSDVSDRDVDTFLSKIQDKTVENDTTLLNIINDKNAAILLAKLRISSYNLSELQIQKLAVTLSRNGVLFEGIDSLGLPASNYLSLSSFVYELVLQITEPKSRWHTALLIAIYGQPIYFLVELMRWVSNPRYKPEDRFSIEHQNILGSIVARRIADFASNELIYDLEQEYATSLLWTWSKWSSKDKVTGYIEQTVNENPENINKLLFRYLNFGLFAGAENVRERYDELSLVVDTSRIYKLLVQIYGEDINIPTKYNDIDDQDQKNHPIRLAHIFSYLYHNPKPK